MTQSSSLLYSAREQSILNSQSDDLTLVKIAAGLRGAAKAIAHAQERIARREAESFTLVHDIEAVSGLQHEFWPICDAYNALGQLLQSSADAHGCVCLPGNSAHVCDWCNAFADSVSIEGGRQAKVNRWVRRFRGGDLNPL